MNPDLYKAAHQGDVQRLREILKTDINALQTVTPRENTALHYAVQFGHREFAKEVLDKWSLIIHLQNSEGDTPMHIAAKYGRLELVNLLAGYAMSEQDGLDSEKGIFMTINKLGNTPLHEAVKNKHSDVALTLLEYRADAAFLGNEKKESPLHIAAREKLKSVVSKILEYPWVPGNEELNGSPLHQAVLGGDISIVEMFLNKNYHKVVDTAGKNALHYAAERDNPRMVEMLLKKDQSLAYVADKDEKRSPLHVAAACGSPLAIKVLLAYCPDAAEQVDILGRNALHIAILNGSLDALKCLLKHIQPAEIINMTDFNGDAPLHLAARKARLQSTLVLLKDKRVDPCIPNGEGYTPRQIIEQAEESDVHEMFIARELEKKERKRCQNNKMKSGKFNVPWHFRNKSNKENHFKFSVETYTLVAALIATVTFAATFTMPGGFHQERGTAILGKHAAFKVFVISNSIAMCCSLIVVFCFIWAWKDPVQFKLKPMIWGHRLIVIACIAMIVTLMTAVYLVVSPLCLWLALVVIFIGCCTPVLAWGILGNELLFVPL